MARRGQRRTLAPCIYQDDSGCAVIVTVRGKLVERRFPPGTPIADLEAERATLKGQQQAGRPAQPGTLRADVLAYLRTIHEPRKRADQTRLLAHWVAGYGDHHRTVLTPLVIRQQLAEWRTGGAAASSCNHRLSALRAVWRAVTEPHEANYPAQVRKLSEPPLEPRALPYTVIARILDALPDRGRPTGQGKGTRPTVSLTKLRLMLMAYTGLPPAQIMRINPVTDIDWSAAALRARPRRKGKGTRETWLPLVPQALDVLRQMVDAGGFGRYSNDSVKASWRRACVKVIEQQIAAQETPLPHRRRPDGTIIPLVRPYDLRHSFGTRALAVSGDLAGVQRLLLHAEPRQTIRYVSAAVPAAAAQTAAALGAVLPPVPTRAAKQLGTKPVKRSS